MMQQPMMQQNMMMNGSTTNDMVTENSSKELPYTRVSGKMMSSTVKAPSL
eukprot:CAMPEP_0116885794 /NCGR_PEP_ID=MMETSP0463-20121206/19382_1 /TAXON_ID=181622 /ORGANISM="Strombidinopsis sp, Strain SopsisLIS2011" /LENGTH=49 /DNA_ID=CAMNT_0004545047 /DNA_START=1 /DNA_END=150 /DNA_ORIENTATION=-